MKVKNAKISLEDYLHLFLSRQQTDLTVNSLNQIISMHGFKKLFGVPKKVLTEAVRALDLVDLSRSTLDDDGVISASAFFDLNDVIADLNELGWQECCVVSIQTVAASAAASSSSATEHRRFSSLGGNDGCALEDGADPAARGGGGGCSSSGAAVGRNSAVKGRRGRKRRHADCVAREPGSLGSP